MIGILWDAVDKLIKRTREIEGVLPKKLSPRPQRGDVVDGARGLTINQDDDDSKDER
jgi:hypothetical protein